MSETETETETEWLDVLRGPRSEAFMGRFCRRLFGRGRAAMEMEMEMEMEMDGTGTDSGRLINYGAITGQGT